MKLNYDTHPCRCQKSVQLAHIGGETDGPAAGYRPVLTPVYLPQLKDSTSERLEYVGRGGREGREEHYAMFVL